MKTRKVVLIGAALGALAAFGLEACGGSDNGAVSSSGAPPEEAGTDAYVSDDGSGPEPTDGGVDGEVTDGGSNIDPDAGEDAGACAANLTLVNDAPARQSDCISVLPNLPGGAIVAGKYHLMEIHALAPKTFCDTQFVTVGFRETAQVTAAGAAFDVESVLQLADGLPRRTTATLTPGPGNTSPMQFDATCPDKPAASVRYASFVRQATGKQLLALLLPYGKGAAVYVFEKVQ